jgi:hypothetical protein
LQPIEFLVNQARWQALDEVEASGVAAQEVEVGAEAEAEAAEAEASSSVDGVLTGNSTMLVWPKPVKKKSRQS